MESEGPKEREVTQTDKINDDIGVQYPSRVIHDRLFYSLGTPKYLPPTNTTTRPSLTLRPPVKDRPPGGLSLEVVREGTV